MNAVEGPLRRRATMLAAIALALTVYAFARLPEISSEERGRLAARFAFTRQPMPEIGGRPYKYVREVHPSLKRISAWMSSLGAAVALADLDGDGLPNDVCHIDPRTDTVLVAPVPGTGSRYQPFVLDPGPLPYNSRTMAPTGCMAADLNEDGRMDLLVYYWGRTPIVFLRRTGSPGVASAISMADFVPIDIIPTGERWYTDAAVFADMDGDGHTDIWIGNYFQDDARTLDAQATGVEEMHNTKSKSYNGGRDRLLMWQGAAPGNPPSVSFRDVPGVLSDEVARGWTLAVGAADLDGDGLPEIYVAHDFGPDRLLHNRSTPGHPRFAVVEGVRRFNDPASCVLGKDSFKGMGVDFGDVDGDGKLDIYVSNIADEYALQESHFLWLSRGDPALMKSGIAPYVHGAEALGLSRSGWGWDARLADFNNDGVLEAVQATGFIKGKTNRWPELQALGTGNDGLMHDPRFWPAFRPGDDVSGSNVFAFFTRGTDGRYHKISAELGMGEPVVSRGIATADVDGDGLLDFAQANQWEPSFFFRNRASGAGRFLGLHLLLPVGENRAFRERAGHPGPDTVGRPAFGASVEARLPDGRRLVSYVDGGNGHAGKRSPDVHLGLGGVDPKAQISVALRWRGVSGILRERTLALTPGWHTVVLGEEDLR
jgi:hypothetical protein